MVANIEDLISRVEGVGEVTVFGSQNAMRIWLNLAKLNNILTDDERRHRGVQAQKRRGRPSQLGSWPWGSNRNATIRADASPDLAAVRRRSS